MKHTRTAVLILLTALLLPVSAVPGSAASQMLLSPALLNIADETRMVKSGLIYTDICFEKADFDRAVGTAVDAITITALPPQMSGTLMIGSTPAAVNQTISAANLNYLRFVPSGSCTETTFRFKASGEYSMACTLRAVTSVNYAPTTEGGAMAVSLQTQRDISIRGTLSGTDPEGDPLTFEITEYPASGLLTLTNPQTGDYKYTPYDGFVGTDAFTYTVCDVYGNYATAEVVTVTVEKPVTEMVLADMEDHWAHNAALVMVAEGAMEVESTGGEIFFKPDALMSREEFLVTVMRALGAGEIPPSDTVFADHDQISEENSGYVNRAYELGIIRGVLKKGGLTFNPRSHITRAEAAVMLNAILGAETPDAVPVFADGSTVPVWARSALYALHAEGIMKGTGDGRLSPSDTLNRAQTAEMLYNIKKMYE